MTQQSPLMNSSQKTLTNHIVLELLAPNLTTAQLDERCRWARSAKIASVCARPCDLRRVSEHLDGARVAVGTVIGFPHGASIRGVKVAEIRGAIDDIASVLGNEGPPAEFGAVINIGRVLSNDWLTVHDEIGAMCDVIRQRGGLLKIIFETGYLDEEQIIRLCQGCAEMGVDFVSTSTGFGPRGATLDDVRLLRAELPDIIRIEAAGNIESAADAEAFITAGATRIRTARAKDILSP